MYVRVGVAERSVGAYLDDLARSVQPRVRQRSGAGGGGLDGCPCGCVVHTLCVPRGDSKDLWPTG